VKGGKMRVRIAVLPVATPATLAAAAVEFNDTMIAPAMNLRARAGVHRRRRRRAWKANGVRCASLAEGQVRAW